MVRRNSTSTPYLVRHINGGKNVQAHSLLEQELRAIRRSLSQLEREVQSNMTEIRSPRPQPPTKAA